MNEKCEYDFCAQNKDGICEEVTCTGNVKVHKPEPNESPSSPQTRGSLPASQADSAFEGTGTQLAPVLRPRCQTQIDNPGGARRPMTTFECLQLLWKEHKRRNA